MNLISLCLLVQSSFSLSGGADDAHGNQTELEAALTQGNAEWEITRYSGVEHGFTAWGGGGYSLTADYRSWESMLTAFEEILPVPTMMTNSTDAPSPAPADAAIDRDVQAGTTDPTSSSHDVGFGRCLLPFCSMAFFLMSALLL